MAAPSFVDLVNLGKAEAVLKRPSLGLRVGDISEMLISGAAAMADRIIGWAAERFAATYVDGAAGDDLTQLAADHWSIQRLDATKATGQVTVTRSSADATAQTLPIGTVVATERDSQGNSVQYVTTTAASWAISTNGARTVNVEAVEAGTIGNLAAINLVTRLVSNPPAGGTYAITSSTQPGGGTAEETDEDLRDRIRQFPSTIRRGTLAALEYGSRSTTGAGVSKATATQDSTGLVTVYVSDASGGSSGTSKMVAPTTIDDGTMTAKVAVELLNWACAGSSVVVTGGAIQTVNITVALVVKLGVDVNQLITDVQAAIEARVNKLKIGDTLYLSDIINAVKSVDPDNIVNVAMVTPVVDTAPSTPGSLIRPGVITVQ